MKRSGSILVLVVTALLPLCLCGQAPVTVGDLSKKQQKLYEKIRADNGQGALGEALKGLNELLDDVPGFTEGYHLRGSIYYDQRNYPEAEKDLKKVRQLDPDYDVIVLYQLALAQKEQEKFGEASGHLEQFLEKGYKSEAVVERAGRHLEDTRFAADAVRHPVPFQPENIGAPVSSGNPEYLPVLSADGQTMIFTRRVNNQEDFFTAGRMGDSWGNVQPLTALNSPFNEGAQSISADGRLMVFTFCQSGADRGGCDLFYAENCGGNWSAPRRIEGQVNTMAWEAQPSLSADGSLLLFASDRPGGHGGRDIWAVRRSRSGEWGNPVNLGPSINTAGNDQCPFLHADGRTFYLCSDGRPGMGGNDLYYIRLEENGQWGSMKNLGYPINTPGNEGTLTVSLDGNTAYFAKSPEGPEGAAAADLDIFTFPLYPEARPLPVTYVQGRIFDSQTKAPLSARAELIDVDTGRPVAIVPSCEDGSYLVCLPAGKNYALNVNKEGYLFFSEHFALARAETNEPFQLDVPLQTVVALPGEVKEDRRPVILKNVFFATGSAELLSASTSELDRLHALLEEHPGLRIQINGHTDNVGSDQDNLSLSEARAKAVYNYLSEKGIDAERLQYKGFGETQPIADNDSEEGRQKNRRTEFEVLQ